MINKKITSEIAIGVIVFVAIVIGGVFWLQSKKVQAPIPQPVATQPTTPAVQTQSAISTQPESQQQSADNFIEYKGNKIVVNLPQSWGELVVPKTDEFGAVISDNLYREKGDQNNIILMGSGLKTEFSKMISDYKYGNKADYAGVPTITLATYPAVFTDDNKNDDFGSLGPQTAKQKTAYFKPLFDVFGQKSIDKLNLSESCFIINNANDNATDCANSNFRGFWWGNNNNIADRVAVHYLENSSSDLRGIGYFAISGQDTPNTIESYKIILVNPEKRILVYIYLPLQGVYSLGTENVSSDEIIPTLKKAYNYLENPANYKSTKLEQFMTEIQGVVSSVKISS